MSDDDTEHTWPPKGDEQWTRLLRDTYAMPLLSAVSPEVWDRLQARRSRFRRVLDRVADWWRWR